MITCCYEIPMNLCMSPCVWPCCYAGILALSAMILGSIIAILAPIELVIAPMLCAVSGMAGVTLFRAPAKPPEKPREIALPTAVQVAAAPPSIKEEGIMSTTMKAAIPAIIVGLIGLMFARVERQGA